MIAINIALPRFRSLMTTGLAVLAFLTFPQQSFAESGT
jgi:hypothetical protein